MRFFQKVRQHFGFAREDLGDAPPTGEMATRRIQQLAGLMNWLPNPDHILQKTGKRVEHLRELLFDDEVFSSVQYLHSSLRETEWELGKHENEDAAAVMRRWLEALDWERIDNEIIEARLFGYQPFEIDWQEEGGLWRPAALTGKPPEWFAYSRDNELKLRTRAGRAGLREDLRDLPPGKFITARNRPSYNNPYGTAVLSRCWWAVVFKKGDLRYWITFAEKFGMPHAVGKHPRGASDEDVEKLLDMLSSMVRDAVAAVPDDSSVELLESPLAGSSGGGGVYKSIIDWTERTINKVILSNEMTTTAGEHGTQALGGDQITEVSGTVVNDCIRMKGALVGKLIRRAWHYNFGAGDDAPRWKEKKDEEAGKERAERDDHLGRQGVRFTEQYYQREYSLKEGDFELVETSPGGPGARSRRGETGGGAFADRRRASEARFAEQEPAGQELIDELSAQATTPETDQADMERLLDEPMRLVQEGESHEQVMQALARSYPQMDAAQLEERLASLFFIAEMWGRLEADQEAETDPPA